MTLGASVTPAQAQWRRGHYHHGYWGPGALVGGALLGLGVGALLATPYVAPPVAYAPPPAYYPPAYAYAPAYPAPYYRPYYRPY